MNFEFLDTVAKKNSNIKFHENPYSLSRSVHADGRTDMTKLTVAFRKFGNASKKMHPGQPNVTDIFESHTHKTRFN